MKRNHLFCLIACLALAFCVTTPLAAKEKKAKTKENVLFCVPMDCQSCVTKIEKNIAFERGVTDLRIDLEKQTVDIQYRSDKTNPEKLAEALKELGFDAEVILPGESPKVPQVAGEQAGHAHR